MVYMNNQILPVVVGRLYDLSERGPDFVLCFANTIHAVQWLCVEAVKSSDMQLLYIRRSL